MLKFILDYFLSPFIHLHILTIVIVNALKVFESFIDFMRLFNICGSIFLRLNWSMKYTVRHIITFRRLSPNYGNWVDFRYN